MSKEDKDASLLVVNTELEIIYFINVKNFLY